MSTYAALLVVCLVGLSVRTTYEVLKRAGRIDTHNRVAYRTRGRNGN